MNQDQIIKALRLIQQWLDDGDIIEARLDLKHLLTTIDPTPAAGDQLFNDLAAALRPEIDF
tara:strand:- start:1286 stop:1468 length:183 start_codon:yes stop_codon:yes gene_type:complete